VTSYGWDNRDRYLSVEFSFSQRRFFVGWPWPGNNQYFCLSVRAFFWAYFILRIDRKFCGGKLCRKISCDFRKNYWLSREIDVWNTGPKEISLFGDFWPETPMEIVISQVFHIFWQKIVSGRFVNFSFQFFTLSGRIFTFLVHGVQLEVCNGPSLIWIWFILSHKTIFIHLEMDFYGFGEKWLWMVSVKFFGPLHTSRSDRLEIEHVLGCNSKCCKFFAIKYFEWTIRINCSSQPKIRWLLNLCYKFSNRQKMKNQWFFIFWRLLNLWHKFSTSSNRLIFGCESLCEKWYLCLIRIPNWTSNNFKRCSESKCPL